MSHCETCKFCEMEDTLAYISVDGDDIGRHITALYLANDVAGLGNFVAMVQRKVQAVTDVLEAAGCTIIFSAADGVVAETGRAGVDVVSLFEGIRAQGGNDLSFSAGVGHSLREAYVALLAAKSAGKDRLCRYADIGVIG